MSGSADTLLRVMKDDATSAKLPSDLTETDVKRMYEGMVAIRCYDERALKLQRSGRVGFCVTSFGEEAAQVGTAHAIEPQDWIFPHYRQYGVAMYLGASYDEMANHNFGNAKDEAKGRQMPAHYNIKKINYTGSSSVIETEITHAVGAAMAMKYKGDDAVAITYFGDGGTSCNDFHAALTFAGVYNAPVLFFLVNNQYAISLPVEKQTGVKELYKKGEGYGVNSIRVDGNDVIAVYQAAKAAAERARDGHGPTLVELLTYRAGSHSSSDDPTRYRSKDEQDEWDKKDPIVRMRNYLKQTGIWTEEYEEQVWEKARAQILEATNNASEVPHPEWETVFDDVYEKLTPQLEEQKRELMERESHLEMTNEGEFPL